MVVTIKRIIGHFQEINQMEDHQIQELVSLNDQTPTYLFYISLARRLLSENGFTEVNEKDEFPENLDKFFVCRDERSIIAFNIGDKSFGHFLTTNLDYPTFKLSPSGYRVHHFAEQVNACPSGKGMWLTWPDRDLTIAGQAFIKDSQNTIKSKLVYPSKTTAYMPMLAVHLKPGSGIKTDLDIEKDFRPVFGFSDKDDDPEVEINGQFKQSPILMKLISEECNCPIEDIANFDLSLISAENSAVIGVNDDMISSQRISSIMVSIIALQEFIESGKPSSGFNCFYGYTYNYETSQSLSGPDSNFLDLTLKRIGISQFNKEFFSSSALYGLKFPCSNGGRGLYYFSDLLGNYQSTMDFTAKTINRLTTAGIKSQLVASKGVNSQGISSIAKRFAMPSFAFGVPIYGLYSIRETVFIQDLQVLRKAIKTILE